MCHLASPATTVSAPCCWALATFVAGLARGTRWVLGHLVREGCDSSTRHFAACPGRLTRFAGHWASGGCSCLARFRACLPGSGSAARVAFTAWVLPGIGASRYLNEGLSCQRARSRWPPRESDPRICRARVACLSLRECLWVGSLALGLFGGLRLVRLLSPRLPFPARLTDHIYSRSRAKSRRQAG